MLNEYKCSIFKPSLKKLNRIQMKKIISLQGDTVVGDGCEIGPDTRLVDCSVGDGATVQNTVGIDSEVGSSAVVGPYAYLPSGSSVAPGVITGAFYTATATTPIEHTPTNTTTNNG